MSVELLATSIKEDNIQIDVLKDNIKQLFLEINDSLNASNKVITDEIRDKYKKIDTQFEVKSKLEARVKINEKEILKLILQ